jgi:hypothetical protein
MPRGRPRNTPAVAGTATSAVTAAPARPAARGRRAAQRPAIPFAYKLVLNQWMLGLFGVEKFEELAELLRNEKLEGLDENNVHHFHGQLTSSLFNLTQLTTEQLREYDQNIVKHTKRLNDRREVRGEPAIVWKYFQYLTLLFTEIYLDRYFRDADGLLAALNTRIAEWNEGKEDADQVAPLDTTGPAWAQLNKLAYWSATGSGKTLLMHVNILQYQFYLDKHGRSRDLNRILLLTPNEGLSDQHLKEFRMSGIEAELFSKDGRGLFAGRAVEILDIHKIKDEMGEKTIAVDAFEGNNLVLIDEGHRGVASGEEGAWMRFRNLLCEKGFSFEYSATFAQAVKGNKTLTDLYATSILFDYTYRYFYGDGFGKDYQILNLDEDTQNAHLELYMTACLLAFYQQLRLFREEEATFKPFNLEKPLWIFVGGSVTKTLATKDASDIVEILKFLGRYVEDRAASIERINNVLNQGLVTSSGRNLFDRRFAYLNLSGLTPSQIFDDTLAALFNAPGGGLLYVENLKGATGEIALRLGDNEPFGVINVGDDAKLVKLCEEHQLQTGEREFSGSLFQDINQPHSTVNLLIGSKKFTEGWSSWRVSTMGLMNVGQGEGAQIIQLFGRGVRLKGYGMSLKRSNAVQLPEGVAKPKHIGVLETLSIFGIRANYMAQFRDFLEEEGLPSNDEREEILLPVIRNLGTQKLKMVRLKKEINGKSTEYGVAFRQLGPVPTLAKPDPGKDEATAYLQKNQVVLNWYPKIQAMQAKGMTGGDSDGLLNQTWLSPKNVAFLDIDRLFFDLQHYKAERGWYNLNLSQDAIVDLLADTSWYRLLIPAEELAFDSFEKVRVWQEIASALLKKYTERYYFFRKRLWEEPHLEYQEIAANDPNLMGVGENPADPYYRILINKSEEEIIAKLNDLKTAIESGKLKDLDFKGLKTVRFGQHLYEPLLYVEQNVVEISPAPLNKGERQFVEDLREYYENNKKEFENNELYLLRNLSRGRGVGFFEAGNFHPDFIVWRVTGDKQRVVFVDPKGIRNVPWDDPKIKFYETVKEIEARLGDPKITLDSYIVSNTPAATMKMMWRVEKDEMLKRHVVFQVEDKNQYVASLLNAK